MMDVVLILDGCSVIAKRMGDINYVVVPMFLDGYSIPKKIIDGYNKCGTHGLV
jgi:hypothetical protein